MTNLIRRISKYMYLTACICFIAVAVVTVLDVVMRRVGFPLDFPFEIICTLVGIVISLAFPETWRAEVHVRVEYIDTKLQHRRLRIIRIFNRLLVSLFLLGVSLNAIMLGNRLRLGGEHSALLAIPEFPVAYILAAGSFIACLVILAGIFRDWKEEVQ